MISLYPLEMLPGGDMQNCNVNMMLLQYNVSILRTCSYTMKHLLPNIKYLEEILPTKIYSAKCYVILKIL